MDKDSNRKIPPPPFTNDQRKMLIEQSSMTLALVRGMSAGVARDSALIMSSMKRVGLWNWIRDVIIVMLLVTILALLIWRAYEAETRPSCFIPNRDAVTFNEQ